LSEGRTVDFGTNEHTTKDNKTMKGAIKERQGGLVMANALIGQKNMH
jgi:hypothetical protein